MTRVTLLVAPLAAFALLACDSTPATPAQTSTPSAAATVVTSTPATSTPGASTTPPAAASGTPVAGPAPKDASYLLGSRYFTLKDGVSEVEAAPGSASKIVTKYFGNEATGDLNGDGTPDVLFILTQSPGGSGTFYFAVAALKTTSGYVGTNGVLLGGRIAPQTTEYRTGTAIVSYADRKPGEPLTAQPSVGISKTFKVVDGKLVTQ